MKAMFTPQLEQIERDYDPDHDINTAEGAPRVTWAEYYLLKAVKELINDVEKLAERVESAGL